MCKVNYLFFSPRQTLTWPRTPFSASPTPPPAASSTPPPSPRWKRPPWSSRDRYSGSSTPAGRRTTWPWSSPRVFWPSSSPTSCKRRQRSPTESKVTTTAQWSSPTNTVSNYYLLCLLLLLVQVVFCMSSMRARRRCTTWAHSRSTPTPWPPSKSLSPSGKLKHRGAKGWPGNDKIMITIQPILSKFDRAFKPAARLSWTTSNLAISWFRGYKIVKGPVRIRLVRIIGLQIKYFRFYQSLFSLPLPFFRRLSFSSSSSPLTMAVSTSYKLVKKRTYRPHEALEFDVTV